jgi:hypothetical protein
MFSCVFLHHAGFFTYSNDFPEILSRATIEGLSITTLSLCMIKVLAVPRSITNILGHEIKKIP